MRLCLHIAATGFRLSSDPLGSFFAHSAGLGASGSGTSVTTALDALDRQCGIRSIASSAASSSGVFLTHV